MTPFARRSIVATVVVVALGRASAVHADAPATTSTPGSAASAPESAALVPTPVDEAPPPVAEGAPSAGVAPPVAPASHSPPRRREPEPQYPTGRGEPQRLEVPNAPDAWFYRPAGGGGRQRVIMYLHGRNSEPHEHCRRLRDFVRPYGWLLCAVGPVDRGGGHHEWHIDPTTASHQVVRALDALVARFPRRVRRHDNIMMGFSEGALVGMNVALMNPRTFPRWLIVAPDDRYIAHNRERIARASHVGSRVYLLVGSADVTLPHSRRAHEILEQALGPRQERFRIVPGMGHALPSDARLVRNIFAWLSRGTAPE